ncbi:hypothetical protein [Gimesia maris]|uniref:Phosphatidate cytidylyltransferase n=1 Tax=Gimesia maris TaxID=122 RepID=A0ABX5YQ89_9PLAN|nr:hypothetical protein [Gimesia maris]EDL60351.1 hypothetical protein PM8797T_25176 [Gimesia maris DSM 8797]QEG17881.1 hypothetical protein GmarT_37650 [Gimesia maris]QGQ29088.1 hypothetical protein F1729_10745 [Gimesia maris]
MSEQNLDADFQQKSSLPVDFRRLLIVLALILLAGALSHYWQGAIICLGASVGMFLAERSGSSRRREFLFLLGIPLLSYWLVLMSTFLLHSDGVTAGQISLWAVIGLCTGIVPAALSVVVLSIASALIDKLTGLRLLKYHWNHNH